jgi:hypothetical protein
MATAKVHHYVPRFLLGRFCGEPAADNPALWRLDKATGRTRRTSVRNEAAVSYYNQLQNVEDLPADFVERTLGLVEERAASIVARLVEGEALDEGERLDVALFVYLQHHRTPRGRHWFVHGFEQSQKLELMHRLLDAGQMREFYRSEGEDVSLEEAQERGRALAQELDTGKVQVKVQHDHAVGAMFMFVEDIVPHIAGDMAWTVIHAHTPDEFIISDHPVLIHDPEAGPDRGVSWLSSPQVRASVPLDSTACLVLRPGPPTLTHERGAPGQVLDLNLGTYASAEWAIYGSTQKTVHTVRSQAKRRKSRVAALTPVPPMLHILERTIGEDAPPTVKTLVPKGKVRSRERWPRWDQ